MEKLKEQLSQVKLPHLQLSALASKGGEELVDQFLLENVSVGEGAGAKRQSQLYIASFWGFHNIVTNLLEQGADINAQNEGTGWTPLHAATFQEHGKVVMLLLEKGANPLIPDSEGRSARDFASASDCMWPHFAAHGCQRISKQDLIDRGIIKKVAAAPSHTRSPTTVSTEQPRLASLSRPGSAYVIQVPMPAAGSRKAAPLGGDVLAEEKEVPTPSTSEWQDHKPQFHVWHQ